MEHYYAICFDNNYLEHHGRKGMKWHQHIFGDDSKSKAAIRRAAVLGTLAGGPGVGIASGLAASKIVKSKAKKRQSFVEDPNAKAKAAVRRAAVLGTLAGGPDVGLMSGVVASKIVKSKTKKQQKPVEDTNAKSKAAFRRAAVLGTLAGGPDVGLMSGVVASKIVKSKAKKQSDTDASDETNKERANSPYMKAIGESRRAGGSFIKDFGYERYTKQYVPNLDHAPTPIVTKADLEAHRAARSNRSKMSGKEAERDLDKIAYNLSDERMKTKSDEEQARELKSTREYRATVWSPQLSLARTDKIANAAKPYLEVKSEPEAVRKAPREALAKECLTEMGYSKSFANDPRILERYSKPLIEARPNEQPSSVKHGSVYEGKAFRIV